MDFPIDFPNYDVHLPSFESDDKIPVIESIPTDHMARVQPPIKCEPVPGKIAPESIPKYPMVKIMNSKDLKGNQSTC